MYFQIDLIQATTYTYNINFFGRCKIKLVNIQYNDNNGTFKVIQIQSTKLKTSLGNQNNGFIFMTNSQQSIVGGTGTTTNISLNGVEMIVDLEGFIDIALIDLTAIGLPSPNGFSACLLTFDLEKIDMLK